MDEVLSASLSSRLAGRAWSTNRGISVGLVALLHRVTDSSIFFFLVFETFLSVVWFGPDKEYFFAG